MTPDRITSALHIDWTLWAPASKAVDDQEKFAPRCLARGHPQRVDPLKPPSTLRALSNYFTGKSEKLLETASCLQLRQWHAPIPTYTHNEIRLPTQIPPGFQKTPLPDA
jgi:hypothetical protein